MFKISLLMMRANRKFVGNSRLGDRTHRIFALSDNKSFKCFRVGGTKDAAIFIVLFWLFGLTAHPVNPAESEQTYDRVSFAMDAVREVENDTLGALLFYQREGTDAGELAKDVNRSITKAVELAKNTTKIKIETLGYQTSPTYRKQALTGWRVRQSIRLKSRNTAAMVKLIAKLQETLAVQSIDYNISGDLRRNIEGELITEAIKSFLGRAQLIAKTLGRSNFRLVQMDVNAQQASPEPVMRTLAAAVSTATPSLEAGTQTVRVTVNGTIELIVN